MSLLENLIKKSKIAAELAKEGPLTIEELLSSYCEVEKVGYFVGLLARFPGLEFSQPKLSNYVLDGTYPFDELIGLEKTDIEELIKLADYLQLPEKPFIENLQFCLNSSEIIESYRFDVVIFFKDFRGIKDLCKMFHLPLEPETPLLSVEEMENAPSPTPREKGVTYTEFAAKLGYLDCLQCLHDSGCPWDESTCDAAAKNGSLECLVYAHENGCQMSVETCAFAAQNGYLDCLKYTLSFYGSVYRIGYMYTKICDYAAASGHLDCLQYAHTHGCPWGEQTCENAAQAGLLWIRGKQSKTSIKHFECLKYLVAARCPINKNRCYEIAQTQEVADWIASN